MLRCAMLCGMYVTQWGQWTCDLMFVWFGLVWLLPFIRWAVELIELQKPKIKNGNEWVWPICTCVRTEKMFDSSCFVAITMIHILHQKKERTASMCVLFLSLTLMPLRTQYRFVFNEAQIIFIALASNRARGGKRQNSLFSGKNGTENRFSS